MKVGIVRIQQRASGRQTSSHLKTTRNSISKFVLSYKTLNHPLVLQSSQVQQWHPQQRPARTRSCLLQLRLMPFSRWDTRYARKKLQIYGFRHGCEADSLVDERVGPVQAPVAEHASNSSARCREGRMVRGQYVLRHHGYVTSISLSLLENYRNIPTHLPSPLLLAAQD